MNVPSQAAPVRTRPTLIPRILGALVVLLLLQAFALGIWHSWRFTTHVTTGVTYPGPLDGQEGTLLHEARLILRGEPLYQPLELDRVVGAPYPPLHAYVLAVAEWFVNPAGVTAPADGRLIFTPGRIISLAGTLLAALFAALTVHQLSKNRLVTLLVALLLLAPAPAQLWATRIKPDLLALALTAAGLYCAARALTQTTPLQRRPLILAALLFAAAFFTKQTYIAAPLAVGASLLLGATGTGEHRFNWRRWLAGRSAFWAFTLTYSLTVALVWLLCDLLTAGQFTFHVWGLHPPEWWIYGRFLRYLGLLAPAWPLAILVLIGVGMLATTLIRERNLPAPAILLPFGYAALGTATIVGSGTIGSHHNHLLEPSMALAIGGATVAGRLLQGSSMRRAGLTAILAAGLLAAQGWSYVVRPAWYGGEFDLQQQNWERFVNLIASQPGEVLSDDVGLLLLAGKDPRYDDPPTMGPAARSGLWDQSGLLAEVEARRFDVILLHFDATRQDIDTYGRWSPEFIATLRQHYRLLYRDLYFSYVPREP